VEIQYLGLGDLLVIASEVLGIQAEVLAKASNLVVADSALHHAEHGTLDLIDLSLWLAQVPCSPLYGSHLSSDRALLAALR